MPNHTMPLEERIHGLIEAQIPDRMFAQCWEGMAPPYQAFVQFAANRLASTNLPSDFQLSASARSSGPNRIRVDGTVLYGDINKSYYMEVVWLPSACLYRGTIELRDTPSVPKPKSIEQFVNEVDAICEEGDIILEGQIFNALEGVDEGSEELPKSYSSIFRLFERFPEEESGMHDHLVHLVTQGGNYEGLLMESIRRVPSIPAIQMAYGLASSASMPSVCSKWLSEMQRVSDAGSTPKRVAASAKELLAHYDSESKA